MTHVAVIGCGVIGAAIAYELSQVTGLKVTVLDPQPPAQASTGAALGVLMGAISHKTKGRAWNLRQTSLQRYETLIPELEAATGQTIPYNRQGVVMLCFEGPELERWQYLVDIRQRQGWQLQIWDMAELEERCPQIQTSRCIAAIHSPGDRQLDPTALTQALVTAAQHNGVEFYFDATVKSLPHVRSPQSHDANLLPDAPLMHVSAIDVETAKSSDRSTASLSVDWVVVAAGLGATDLTQFAPQPLDIRPVLGQAMCLRLGQPLGYPTFQPVISGEDIHIVPAGDRDHCEYWIGATVEFPAESGNLSADPDQLQDVLQRAIALCPALAHGTVLKTWSGLRPRPFNRPAPIIEPLTGYNNVLLATGHYRNGVLLAPATAIAIREKMGY